MEIKGRMNREVAKKVYRTYEQDDMFMVLDNKGRVALEADGVGYLADEVSELYEYFDPMMIDFMVMQTSKVPICPVCKKPLQPGELSFCRKHTPKDTTVPDEAWLKLAGAVCIQAIKDYDHALDMYADDPLNTRVRDRMLNLEMWILGDEWKVYTMDKVDGKEAVEARKKAAQKRYEKRRDARLEDRVKVLARNLVDEYLTSLISEIDKLEEELAKYEDRTAEGKGIEGKGKAV